MKPNTTENIQEKLISNSIIDPTTGCWLWQGAIDSGGYGTIRFEGKIISIHRLCAILYLGLNPSNLESCALHKLECPNKNCWNPDHLYIGTRKENTADMDSKGRNKRGRYKTHCPKGHEYNEKNTRTDKKGAQTCRECNRLRYYGS